MKTIDEIQGELRNLIHELDHLKEERLANDSETDWEHISVDAARRPIKPHPLERFDKYTQKNWLNSKNSGKRLKRISNRKLQFAGN